MGCAGDRGRIKLIDVARINKQGCVKHVLRQLLGHDDTRIIGGKIHVSCGFHLPDHWPKLVRQGKQSQLQWRAELLSLFKLHLGINAPAFFVAILQRCPAPSNAPDRRNRPLPDHRHHPNAHQLFRANPPDIRRCNDALGPSSWMSVTGDHIGGCSGTKASSHVSSSSWCRYLQIWATCVREMRYRPRSSWTIAGSTPACPLVRVQDPNAKFQTSHRPIIGVAVEKADVGGNNACPFGLITIISLHAL